MYDRHLDSFIKVVEHGSFAAAGEDLFVTGNAVMKQINCLERDLGVRLFDRDNHGTRLTPAGREIYEGALDIVRRSQEVVTRAKLLQSDSGGVVRLASSMICPTKRVGQWWSQVSAAHPLVKLEITPVIDKFENWMQITEHYGEAVDAMVAPEPLADWPYRATCEIRPLFTSPACICVPMGHRLAGAERLCLEDLEGERLYLVSRGNNTTIERIRDAIDARHLHMDIVDCLPYDLDPFNSAVRDGAIMMHCAELGEVHPSMVNIEFEGFPFLFCLEYSKGCSDAVREFADAVCELADAERNAFV